jgi:hypothetical protein
MEHSELLPLGESSAVTVTGLKLLLYLWRFRNPRSDSKQYHLRLWRFQLWPRDSTLKTTKSGWSLLLEPTLSIELFILSVLLLAFSVRPRKETHREYLLPLGIASLLCYQVSFSALLVGYG